jgi:hypothetical protein
MTTCNIYILPAKTSVEECNLKPDNETIHVFKHSNHLMKFNLNSIKSYFFEQTKNIYRFYFYVNDTPELTNQILVLESNKTSLIDFIIEHKQDLNLTSPTMPYWAIFLAKHNIYYHSYLFYIIAFMIAISNVVLLIYNFAYPYISKIDFIKIVENSNIIKYFDIITNLYIYTIVTKMTESFKTIYSLIPDLHVYTILYKFGDLFLAFYKLIPNFHIYTTIAKILNIFKVIYDLLYWIISSFIPDFSRIYNLFPNFSGMIYNLIPNFSGIYNLIPNFKNAYKAIPKSNDGNNNQILSKLLRKGFDLVRFVSSFILSDFYRLRYRAIYLIFGLMMGAIIYMSYLYFLS